ncbi:MAG: Gfo/Idh/MocA family oxidoreductase [Thermoguttaceae bacterium]
MTKHHLSRRRFLATTAAACTVVPRRVLGGPNNKPPSEKLNIACVGLGAMGGENLQACETENIVALCDVDSRAAAVTFKRYGSARQFTDYRKMFDQAKDIDAVIVATPDHTHAVITAEAMRRGKHVYTQMPLAHDVWEARQLARLAADSGVATQMGNERYSAPTLRRVCEWIWDGAIGPVREVHCWTNRPQWPQGIARPKDTPAVPSHLDWDLWLGPAPMRPYHPAYVPYDWRGWQDFGTGALGAMGCHVMDGVYWALKLGEADRFTVEADSTGVSSETFPQAATVRYRFPGRGTMPPVNVHWYDGGRRPPRPKELPDTREFLGSNGTIFVGEKGKLVFGAITAGTNPGQAGPRLMPESLMRDYRPPQSTIPRVAGTGKWVKASRHVQEWIRACKGGKPACSRFEIAGPLTELALLGNVALLSGKTLQWNVADLNVENEPEANRYVRRPYRKGWQL